MSLSEEKDYNSGMDMSGKDLRVIIIVSVVIVLIIIDILPL